MIVIEVGSRARHDRLTRAHRPQSRVTLEHLDLIALDVVAPAIPGSAATQFSVTDPNPTVDPVNDVAAGNGSLEIEYSSMTMSEWLFDGSNATNFNVVGASGVPSTVIGPV